MRRFSGAVFLGVLFLVMSTSKVFVVAQQTALKDATTAKANATSEQVAALLSGVFGNMANSFTTLAGLNATATNGTAAGLKGANGTAASNSTSGKPKTELPPNLAALLKTMNGTGNNTKTVQVVNALEDALRQQQQAGDLTPLESAAMTVKNFLNLPTPSSFAENFGTGANIQQFLDAVDKLKTLYDNVSGFLDPSSAITIAQNLITAEQLAIEAAGLPLGVLAFFTALIALGAGITGLIAGIFYCVGSALSLAAVLVAVGPDGLGGPVIPTERDSSNTTTNPIADNEWYKGVVQSASGITDQFLPYAFSTGPFSLLRMVDTTLGGVNEAAQAVNSTLNGPRPSLLNLGGALPNFASFNLFPTPVRSG